MRVAVAVAQVPVGWSARRNTSTILAEATTGGSQVLRHTIDLAASRDGYLSQRRADLVTVTYRARGSSAIWLILSRHDIIAA